MTVSLSENRAVFEPMKALTPILRDCLLSVDFYRHHKRAGAYWIIGTKRFSDITMAKLVDHGLVRRGQRGLVITMAGHLAITKLKGKGL